MTGERAKLTALLGAGFDAVDAEAAEVLEDESNTSQRKYISTKNSS